MNVRTLIAAGGIATLAAVTVQANIRLRFPGDYPGPPLYAQISNIAPFGEEIYHSNDWAAIPFHRAPNCVPPAFNLLDMFHYPSEGDPGALGCTLTVQGLEIWPTPPWEGGAGPIHVTSWGMGAVPIYFVSWPELQVAVADGVLTMTELHSLESLKIGYASFFSMSQNPSGLAKVPHIEISARGSFADGQQFQFQVAGGDQSALVKHVQIVFW